VTYVIPSHVTVRRTIASSMLAAAFLLVLLVQVAPVSAQTTGSSTSSGNATSMTVSSYSTGTNIPASTGCTPPADAAPASLITTLGTNSTHAKRESMGQAPRRDIYLFLGGALLTGLLVLIGIVWLVVYAVTRGSRRNDSANPNQRRSHAGRNAFVVVFIIAILIFATGSYLIAPYLTKAPEAQSNGVLENIVNPNSQFGVDPISIKYFYVEAYVNGASTLLEGNFSVASGPDVQVVIIPDTLRNQFFGDLENGTFSGGISGCTVAGIPTLYDSGLVSSGAFAVAVPPVSNQTQYDVVFANPSMNQSTSVSANVYYGY
jgi:hypothetical protein